MPLVEQEYAKRWNGLYRGIPIEIVAWISAANDKIDWCALHADEFVRDSYGRSPVTWNYYLLVGENMLAPADFEAFWLPVKERYKKRPTYDYYVEPLISLGWHGGITFYEKNASADGEPRSVKMGCDFAHSFDDDLYHCFESVLREAQGSVDALRNVMHVKERCHYNGGYYWREEGGFILLKSGEKVFYSREGLDASNEFSARYGHSAKEYVE